MATRGTKKKTAGREHDPQTSRSPRAKSGGKKLPRKRAAGLAGRGTRNLLLRDLDPDVLRVLEARAARSGRSLQQELHVALRRDARRNFAEARATVEAWHSRLAGRRLADSAELIREDRER